MINSTRSIEKGNGRKDRAKEMQFCDSKLHPTPRSTNKNTNKARIVCNSSPKAKKGKKAWTNVCTRDHIYLKIYVSYYVDSKQTKPSLLQILRKPFLWVSLQESSRDVTQFLWLQEISKPMNQEKILTYHSSRVSFAIICSSLLFSGSQH